MTKGARLSLASWQPRHYTLEVSEEERLAEYENRWASGGLSPYYAFTDSLLSMESNQTMADFARAKIRERVDDPAVAEKLCPDYPILTRRLSPETNYLEAFNQANVELIDLHEHPISRFTSDGIVVGDTEIKLDAVIFATGFDVMTGAMDRIDIRGREDQGLKARWAESVTSHLGMMTHGFPNLLMQQPIQGLLPNVAVATCLENVVYFANTLDTFGSQWGELCFPTESSMNILLFLYMAVSLLFLNHTVRKATTRT